MKLLGFDCETFLIQPGLITPRLVCGSWASETEEWITNPADTESQFIAELSQGTHLVGVNIAYDVGVMASHNPALLPLIFKAGNAGLFHCCSIREALHDISQRGVRAKGDDFVRYSMALMMDIHFKQDISAEKTGDVWRYKYAQLDGVPLEQWPQAAVDYPKLDARRARDLCVNQKRLKYKNLHDEAAQVRAAIAIQLMIAWGFRTDGAYISELETQVDRAWDEAREEFAKLGIYRPDGTKNKARLSELVTRAYNGDPPRTKKSERFPNGQISTDRDTLVDSGDPLLTNLGEGGTNDKRKTTYLPALKQGIHAPVTSQFNVLVNTGRVSSDWQQMPQSGGLREAIIARPDTVLLSCDYGGLELRTMAQRAINEVGFSKMAEFINQKKDTHAYVAGFFLGYGYEEIKALVDAKDPRAVNFRKLGKEFNFSKGGGSGPDSLVYSARKKGISYCTLAGRPGPCGKIRKRIFVKGDEKRICLVCSEVAKELGEKWLKAWPEQGILFERASKMTAKGRKVESVTFGSNRVRGNCGYTQWLNNPFQSAGGDGMKRAMWRIAEESYTDRRSPLWGCRAFLQVHDELLAELPWDRRHDAAFRIAEVMVKTMNGITPDAENEVVPAIMRRLFKSASDVYDKQGVLKPYWAPSWSWAPDSEVMARDLAA